MRVRRAGVLALSLVGLLAFQAEAVPVLFTFDGTKTVSDPNVLSKNTLAPGANSMSGTDPIETYMENIWAIAVGNAKKDITVNWSAQVRHTRIENVFTTPYLGNSDGATSYTDTTHPSTNPASDNYLFNRWNVTPTTSSKTSSSYCVSPDPCQRDRITITFEQQPISSVAFDWEIFPINSSSDIADFTFYAYDTHGGLIDLVDTHTADGHATYYRPALPASGSIHPRRTEGDVGHVYIPFPRPVKTLVFKDWSTGPIGIDNLLVTTPEPSTLLLLCTALAGLGAAGWRRRGR